MEEELTARSMSSSVVSGRRRRRRIDRGELRWPATETAMVAALQHVREVRSSTRRWRGLWRSSEAGRGGEGRPVATVMPVGGGGGSRVRGRESRGRRGGRGRVRAVRGSCVASSGASRESGEAGGGQQGGRWRARVPASVGHTPSSFCPRRETTEGSGGGLGRQLEMGQVSGPGKSLSPFLFSFLIF